MLGRQKCVDCGRLSPEANGEITLTTSFGWRLRRATMASGDAVIEWRCETCWPRFKAAQRPPPAEAPISVPPSSNAGKEPGKR